jgi:hypothetical protein
LNFDIFFIERFVDHFFSFNSSDFDKKREVHLATISGWKSPADCEMSLVSSGLNLSSSFSPGVSVSGGQLTVTVMPKGATSEELKLILSYQMHPKI